MPFIDLHVCYFVKRSFPTKCVGMHIYKITDLHSRPLTETNNNTEANSTDENATNTTSNG